MREQQRTRRDFNHLAMAAMAGLTAGMLFPPAAMAEDTTSQLLKDPHVCRGLNTCKGKGASKANACAGQGTCATSPKHTCSGSNACKGQGGCGANPGENSCKTMGSCEVPLGEKGWKTARANFEAAMKKAGKSVGPAPKA